jgi:hypothetical protein
MTIPFDGAALFDALARHRVRYVVIGGFAVIAHGVIRTTEDLDICPDPDPENLGRLAALLAESGAEQLGAGEFEHDELPYDPTHPEHLQRGGNFRVMTQHGPLDVMEWVPGIEDEHAFARLAARAVSAEFRGAQVLVASFEDLQTMKRAAGRQQDLEDLRRLELAHGEPGPSAV